MNDMPRKKRQRDAENDDANEGVYDRTFSVAPGVNVRERAIFLRRESIPNILAAGSAMIAAMKKFPLNPSEGLFTLMAVTKAYEKSVLLMPTPKRRKRGNIDNLGG